MRKIAYSGFLVILACSSDEASPDTPSKFCEQWAAAACSAEVVSACQAGDVNDCQASQIAFCLELIPATGFSGARAAQCTDAVESAYSDADLTASELETVLRLAAPCDQLVRGPRTRDEVCSARLDCDAPAGFDCVFKDDDSTGTCQVPTRVGPGLDCSAASAVCETGFYCNGENCIAGQDIGEACVAHRECGSAGFCSSGLCAERFDVDLACTNDEQCTSGLCYQFSATEQVCTDRLRLSRTEPICEDLR